MINNIQAYLTLENIYLICNWGVIPFWLMLIIFPYHNLTKILVQSIFAPLLLAIAYIYIGYKIFLEGNIFEAFYLYFGLDTYLMILSGAIFNVGLGTWITLYGGLLNKQPLKLNVKAKAFENTQAFSGTQFILVLPKMVLPVLLYTIPARLINYGDEINHTAGIISLALSGIVGLVFKKQILNLMVKRYTPKH